MNNIIEITDADIHPLVIKHHPKAIKKVKRFDATDWYHFAYEIRDLIEAKLEHLTLEQIKALYVQKGGDLGELIGEQIIHAKPVGIAFQSSMYKGVTLATFDANSVPVNTKLYTKPINPVLDDVAKDAARY